MSKFAFIGAGSFLFTRGLVKDILEYPAFQDAEIALMDIDDERLAFTKKAVELIIKNGNYPAKVFATKNRVEALKNADGVLCTILQSGVEVFKNDVEIPKKYGVDINVGDTRGPAGIFRAMRTLPAMLEICKDIEKYCPNAVFLNYTNPMAMLCRAMQQLFPKLTITGLCHSVQGTAAMLAKWIGAKLKDISYLCAGINHQAWYLEYRWKGKDAIPLIRKAIQSNADILNEEQVRNELFLRLDYYVTESSGHNSEYFAWFRKRDDLIEKYCTHGTGWNPGKYAFIRDSYRMKADTWKDSIKEELYKLENKITDKEEKELGDEFAGLELKEYASSIFNAVFGDNTIFQFNGNLRNFNLVDNLPYGCCVEVPALASKHGIRGMHVGKLPDQLALITSNNAQCEELAVQGILEKNKRKIYHAICYDPLTAAVLSLEEIQAMVDEMFEANKDWIEEYH